MNNLLAVKVSPEVKFQLSTNYIKYAVCYKGKYEVLAMFQTEESASAWCGIAWADNYDIYLVQDYDF